MIPALRSANHAFNYEENNLFLSPIPPMEVYFMIRNIIIINVAAALFAFGTISELNKTTPDMSVIPKQIESHKNILNSSQDIEETRTIALINLDKFDSSAKVVNILIKLIKKLSISLIVLSFINIALLILFQRRKATQTNLKE